MRITRLEEVIGQGVFLRTRTARNEKLSRHLAFSGECEAASSLVARLRPDSFVEVSVLSSCLAAERVALTTEAVVKRGRGFDLRKNLTGPGRGWSDRSSSSWYDAPQNDVRHVREPGLPCGVFTSPCRLSSPRSGKRDVEPLSGDLLCRASFEDGGVPLLLPYGRAERHRLHRRLYLREGGKAIFKGKAVLPGRISCYAVL